MGKTKRNISMKKKNTKKNTKKNNNNKVKRLTKKQRNKSKSKKVKKQCGGFLDNYYLNILFSYYLRI